MPKVILQFDFNDPDDKIAFDRASNALKLCGCLWDITQYFRGLDKWENNALGKPKSEDECDQYDKIREKVHEIMNKHNINLDEWYS